MRLEKGCEASAVACCVNKVVATGRLPREESYGRWQDDAVAEPEAAADAAGKGNVQQKDGKTKRAFSQSKNASGDAVKASS